MKKHKRAIVAILIAIALDVVGGIAFAAADHISVILGLYWAVSTATTVGYGDITPHGVQAHIITVMVMLTVIPLFAATFSLLTTGLTATHVQATGKELHDKLDEAHHLMHHIIKNSPDIPNEVPGMSPEA